jgi:hypothetical protein
MANKKFGLKEVMDVTLYDTVTGKPVMNFDTLKVSTIENGAEQVSAQGGKGNAKLITWDFNRTAQLKMQDALLTTKSFEILSGNAVTTGNATIFMRQNTVWDTSGASPIDKGALFPLTASGAGAIELAYTPLELAANILVYDADDDCGTPLAAGTLSGKTLTNAAWANKKVIAYYSFTAANATTFLITSDKFAGTYKSVGSTVIRNATTGKDEAFQVVINNLKFKSNFTLTMQASGDPSAFDMEAEIQREANNSKMITMIQY